MTVLAAHEYEAEAAGLRERIADLERRRDELSARAVARASAGGRIPLGTLPLFLCRTDSTGTIQVVSGNWSGVLGTRWKDIHNTALAELLPDAADAIRKVLGGGRAASESRVGRGDDRRRVLVHLDFDRAHGSGLIAAVLDVTEYADTRTELAASTRRFRDLTEKVPIGIVRITAPDVCTQVNDEVCRIMGVSAAGLVGRSWLDWVHPEDMDQMFEDWVAGIGASAQRGYEYRVLRPDGQVRWVQTYAVAEFEEDGEVIGHVGPLVDVTEQRKSEERIRALHEQLNRRVQERTAKLEKANEELEAFCYSVSHDLRSPLRTIDGFCQVLLEEASDRLEPEGRKCLSRTRVASQSLGRLIDDLLHMSRMTRSPPERASVDLTLAVKRISRSLHETAPRRSVRWEIEEGVVADADRTLIETLLTHLIDNAWKFTGSRAAPRIQFGTLPGRPGAATVYFVSDNGVGFEMAHADHLFVAFQKLNTDAPDHGKGIGLALVERITRRHGGRVWAEGKPNSGATFYFTMAPDDGTAD